MKPKEQFIFMYRFIFGMAGMAAWMACYLRNGWRITVPVMLVMAIACALNCTLGAFRD